MIILKFLFLFDFLSFLMSKWFCEKHHKADDILNDKKTEKYNSKNLFISFTYNCLIDRREK